LSSAQDKLNTLLSVKPADQQRTPHLHQVPQTSAFINVHSTYTAYLFGLYDLTTNSDDFHKQHLQILPRK